MDGSTPTECICGAQNFERVTVARRGKSPYRTDFIACAECRIMYFDPEPFEPEPVSRLSTVTTTNPHLRRK
jgi:hypothetical protein